MIPNLHPILQTCMGTAFTWGLTALGAALVFVFSGGQVLSIYFRPNMLLSHELFSLETSSRWKSGFCSRSKFQIKFGNENIKET